MAKNIYKVMVCSVLALLILQFTAFIPVETDNSEPAFSQYAFFLSPTLFDDNHVVAYYGHPRSRIMGIVGRHSMHELTEMVKKTAAGYDLVNGERGVIPAFYLIYGTCQPEGNIGIMNRNMVESYIIHALQNGMLVYLDHQIGRFTVEAAVNTLLPFLKFPNVHLALDPEWRTQRPMKEIGRITAHEINTAQKMMRDYMTAHNIQGRRQLIVHQFHWRMIVNRKQVSVDYYPVKLIHVTSGWGNPELKMGTHQFNSHAVNMPYKGFKLWYFYKTDKGVHFDNPLMTPEQVLGLSPQPLLIIYQ